MSDFITYEKKSLLHCSGKKKYLGILHLNRPKALNALNLDMIRILQKKFIQWEEDPDVVLIILQATGDKAFCAGGDVRTLGENLKKHGDKAHSQSDIFFLEEFFMDYYVHKMQTPTLAWADRIVMGGGMGVIAGMDFRIVTERSLLAMPEITIGYFPDVGASYFLNKMPGNLGLYMGLTGLRIQGKDAVYLGFANFLIHSCEKESVMKEIYRTDWKNNNQENKKILGNILFSYSMKDSPSVLSQKKEVIDKAMDEKSLKAIQENILSLEGDFLKSSKESFLKGSPTSKTLILEQFKRGRSMDLESCFSMEWILAANVARHPDFFEGIRSLLIDKDNSPNWASLEGIKVGSFFQLSPSVKKNLLELKIQSFLSE